MFKNILVPVDLEHADTWDDSLSYAVGMAKTCNARLHLMTVIHSPPAIVSNYLPKGFEEETSERAGTALQATAQKLDVEGTVACHVRHGEVYQEVLKLAREIDTDLIIIESHKPGVADYLLGTVAARVVRHAQCSVFVLRVDER